MTFAWLPPKMVDADGNTLVVGSPSGEVVPGTVVGIICHDSESVNVAPAFQLVFRVDTEWDRQHRQGSTG